MNNQVTQNLSIQNTGVAPAGGDTDTGAPAPRVSSKLIGTVHVELDAVLGQASMSVAELTALSAGNVVSLDAQLNAAVELRLNQVTIARGELVAVGEKFGVRLTEITQCPD